MDSRTDLHFAITSHLTLFRYVEFEPESELKTIGIDAFNGSHLEKILIPRSVEEIGHGGLSSVYLREVEFESASQLRIIGPFAFAKTNLSSISIPDSVLEIGDCCFRSVPLVECIIGENSQLTSIGVLIFRHLPHFFVPSKLRELRGKSFSGVESVTIAPENPYFCVCGKFIMSRDGITLYETLGSVNSVTIPRSVKRIGKACFAGKNELTSVEYEDESELEVVEERAFEETSIRQIAFPRSPRHIGEYCFNQTNIATITFHDQCPLEEIPDIGYNGRADMELIHVSSNVSRIAKETLRRAKNVRVSENNPYMRVSGPFVGLRSGACRCDWSRQFVRSSEMGDYYSRTDVQYVFSEFCCVRGGIST